MQTKYFGKYEILSVLEKANSFEVYKAKDSELNRTVVIKFFDAIKIDNENDGQKLLAKFREDVTRSGKLHHPNIVPIFEAGRDNTGSPFIVMEHLEGETLASRILKQGALPPEDALHYLAQVASALDFAHRRGNIHGAVHPNNIFIDSNRRAYMLGFGLESLRDLLRGELHSNTSTLAYLSPEQIKGSALSERVDIYSLSTVLFESLTGVRPFPGAELEELKGRILKGASLRLKEVGVTFAPDLEEILEKGFSLNPQDRYQSAGALLEKAGKIFNLHVEGSGVVGEAQTQKPTATQPASGKVQTQLPRIDWPKEENSFKTFAAEHSSPEAALSKMPDSKIAERSNLAPNLRLVTHEEKEQTPGKNASLITPIRESGMSLGKLAGAVLGITLLVALAFGVSMQESSEEIEDIQLLDTPLEASVETITPDEITEASIPSLTPEQVAAGLLLQQLPLATKKLLIARAGEVEDNGVTLALIRTFAQEPTQETFMLRVAALKALSGTAHLQTEETFAAFQSALSDPDFLVRGFATRGLIATKRPEAVPLLENQLATEQNEVVKKVLSEGIEKLKQENPL